MYYIDTTFMIVLFFKIYPMEYKCDCNLIIIRLKN